MTDVHTVQVIAHRPKHLDLETDQSVDLGRDRKASPYDNVPVKNILAKTTSSGAIRCKGAKENQPVTTRVQKTRISYIDDVNKVKISTKAWFQFFICVAYCSGA